MLRAILFCCFLSLSLLATEESPWIENVLKPYFTFTGGYQHFDSFDQKGDRKAYPGRGAIFSGGVYFAPPIIDISLQAELFVTRTHRHPWVIDHLKETVRFALTDDALGDPFASTIGLSLFQTPTVALHDPDFIHHAHFEAELHYAIGKECAPFEDWDFRMWGLGAVGMGTRGSPWLRGLFVMERFFNCNQFAGIFISGEAGLGSRQLCVNRFHNYGSIAYRRIDTGFYYTYRTDDDAFLTFRLSQGVYSRNAPYLPTLILFELDYPFSF